MELNEFIKNVIVNIYDGLEMAKKETGKVITPNYAGSIGNGYYKDPTDNISKPLMDLEFEVALSNSEKDSKNGGIGVMLSVVKLGANAESESNQISTSKIKFKIPMHL